jgi:hypothetical protein
LNRPIGDFAWHPRASHLFKVSLENAITVDDCVPANGMVCYYTIRAKLPRKQQSANINVNRNNRLFQMVTGNMDFAVGRNFSETRQVKCGVHNSLCVHSSVPEALR